MKLFFYPRELLSFCTLFQRLNGHFLVLCGPQSLPHLSKVSLSQFLVQSELLSRPLPRLHVKQLPLHRHNRASGDDFQIKTVSNVCADEEAAGEQLMANKMCNSVVTHFSKQTDYAF